MKTDIEVLDQALSLVEKDEGWTKGTFCRNAEGHSVSYTTAFGWVIQPIQPLDNEGSAPPVSFCLEGAIRYAAGMMDPLDTRKADDLAKALYISQQCDRLERLVLRMALDVDSDARPWSSSGLNSWNDRNTTTHEDAVLALKLAREEMDED